MAGSSPPQETQKRKRPLWPFFILLALSIFTYVGVMYAMSVQDRAALREVRYGPFGLR